MRTLLALSLGLAALVPSLAHAQMRRHSVPAPGAPRCFALAFGAWGPPPASADSTLYRPLPTFVRLSPVVFDRSERGTLYRAQRESTDSTLRVAWWERVGRDSIRVTFPSWWSTGISLRLPATGDTLLGVASVYVDVVGAETPSAPVRATATPCPPPTTDGRRRAREP